MSCLLQLDLLLFLRFWKCETAAMDDQTTYCCSTVLPECQSWLSMTRICDSTLCARMMLTARSLSTRYASGGFLRRRQSQLVVWRRFAKRRTPVNAVVTCILVEVLTTFDHFRSWSMLAGSRMTCCCVRVLTGRHPPSMKSSLLTRASGLYVGFEYVDKTSFSSS